MLAVQVVVFNAISFFYGCQTLLVMLNTSNILLIIGTIITIVILVLLAYHIKTTDDKCDVTTSTDTSSDTTSANPASDTTSTTGDTTNAKPDSNTASDTTGATTSAKPATPVTPDAKDAVDATTAANSDENGESIDPQDYNPPSKAKSPDKPKKDTTDTVVETYASTTKTITSGFNKINLAYPHNTAKSSNKPGAPDPQMFEPPSKAAKTDAKQRKNASTSQSKIQTTTGDPRIDKMIAEGIAYNKSKGYNNPIVVDVPKKRDKTTSVPVVSSPRTNSTVIARWSNKQPNSGKRKYYISDDRPTSTANNKRSVLWFNRVPNNSKPKRTTKTNRAYRPTNSVRISSRYPNNRIPYRDANGRINGVCVYTW